MVITDSINGTEEPEVVLEGHVFAVPSDDVETGVFLFAFEKFAHEFVVDFEIAFDAFVECLGGLEVSWVCQSVCANRTFFISYFI